MSRAHVTLGRGPKSPGGMFQKIKFRRFVSHTCAKGTFFYHAFLVVLRLRGHLWPERMTSLGPVHIRQRRLQSNVQAQQKTVNGRSWMQPRPAKDPLIFLNNPKRFLQPFF